MGLIGKIQNLRMKLTHRPIQVLTSYVEPQNEFKGKKAMVVGGTGEIGLAIAKRLKDSGCKVIICGRKEINDDFDFCKWDVSNIDQIEDSFNDIANKYGGIDIVVNSQGLNPPNDFYQEFLKIDHKDFEDVFKVNVESVYFICLAAYRHFVNKGIKGHILNICSTEGLRAGVVPYGISKASTISLTRGFGREFAKKGVVCNGIAPGTTSTKMIHFNGDLSHGSQLTGRMNTVEEIANLAAFLIGDTGNQMNGEVVVMDGASILR